MACKTSVLSLALLSLAVFYWTPSTAQLSVANDYQLVYSVVAYFEMNGIKGTISISQKGLYDPASIAVRLNGFPRRNIRQDLDWTIREYPVRYSLLPDFPCSESEVGGVFDPRNLRANSNYDSDCSVENSTFCAVGDLGRRLGYLRNTDAIQTFSYRGLQLRGPYSPVGRSIVIRSAANPNVTFACANIERQGLQVTTLRAVFDYPARLQGEVVFRYVEGRSEVTIYADLYRRDGGRPNSGVNVWTLREAISPGTCSALYQVYGYSNAYNNNSDFFQYLQACNRTNPRSCIIGNLTEKCGGLVSDNKGRMRAFCTDVQLGSVPLSNLLPLTLTIQNNSAPPFILDCSALQVVSPEAAVVLAQTNLPNSNIFVNLLFFQPDPYQRTLVRSYYYYKRTPKPVSNLEIRDPKTGQIWARKNQVFLTHPLIQMRVMNGAVITGDMVPLGDLKYKVLTESSNPYRKTDASLWLPLYGRYNITNQLLVLKDTSNGVLLSASIQRYANPVSLYPSFLGYT